MNRVSSFPVAGEIALMVKVENSMRTGLLAFNQANPDSQLGIPEPRAFGNDKAGYYAALARTYSEIVGSSTMVLSKARSESEPD